MLIKNRKTTEEITIFVKHLKEFEEIYHKKYENWTIMDVYYQTYNCLLCNFGYTDEIGKWKIKLKQEKNLGDK